MVKLKKNNKNIGSAKKNSIRQRNRVNALAEEMDVTAIIERKEQTM